MGIDKLRVTRETVTVTAMTSYTGYRLHVRVVFIMEGLILLLALAALGAAAQVCGADTTPLADDREPHRSL
jgi:hypothetical protein